MGHARRHVLAVVGVEAGAGVGREHGLEGVHARAGPEVVPPDVEGRHPDLAAGVLVGLGGVAQRLQHAGAEARAQGRDQRAQAQHQDGQAQQAPLQQPPPGQAGALHPQPAGQQRGQAQHQPEEAAAGAGAGQHAHVEQQVRALGQQVAGPGPAAQAQQGFQHQGGQPQQEQQAGRQARGGAAGKGVEQPGLALDRVGQHPHAQHGPAPALFAVARGRAAPLGPGQGQLQGDGHGHEAGQEIGVAQRAEEAVADDGLLAPLDEVALQGLGAGVERRPGGRGQHGPGQHAGGVPAAGQLGGDEEEGGIVQLGQAAGEILVFAAPADGLADGMHGAGQQPQAPGQHGQVQGRAAPARPGPAEQGRQQQAQQQAAEGPQEQLLGQLELVLGRRAEHQGHGHQRARQQPQPRPAQASAPVRAVQK